MGVAEAVELLAGVVDEFLVELDADVMARRPAMCEMSDAIPVPEPTLSTECLLELEASSAPRRSTAPRGAAGRAEGHVHVNGLFGLLVVDELAAVDRAEGGDDLRAKGVVRGWMDVFAGRIACLLREADVVLELVNHGIIATWAVPELAEEALQCHQRGWRGRGRSNFRGVLSGRKQADFARSLGRLRAAR